jgi:hypothetical protein
MSSVPDISSQLGPAEHLLVITPPGGTGCYGLRLPFHDAALIEAKPNGLPEAERPGQPVDSVVIESPAGDVGWADRILGELDALISDTSTVVLALVAEYPGFDGGDRSPAALPALRRYHVTSMGLLGDAVSLVLARGSGRVPGGEADAAVIAAAVGKAVELATLAPRGGKPRSSVERYAARNLAATISVLRGEIQLLSTALTKAQEELSVASRGYDALRRSRLGKMTLRYWQFRRKLRIRRAMKGTPHAQTGQAARPDP